MIALVYMLPQLAITPTQHCVVLALTEMAAFKVKHSP